MKKELVKLRKKTKDIINRHPELIDRNDFIKKKHFKFLLGEYFNMDARSSEHITELVEANSATKSVLEMPKGMVKFRPFDYALESLRMVPEQVTKLRDKMQTGYEVIPDDVLGEFNNPQPSTRAYGRPY